MECETKEVKSDWIWFHPSTCSGQITRDQEKQWREQGYILIDGLLESSLIEEAVKGVNSVYNPAINPDVNRLREKKTLVALNIPSLSIR